MSNRCPLCENVNSDDSLFCEHCGQRLLPSSYVEPTGKRGNAVIISPTGRTVLNNEEVTIGRDPGNKLVFNDLKMSRRHAVIRREANSYEILDLGSSNGTFVNGQRLGSTARPLNGGDTIRVGDVLFTFEYEAQQTHESTIIPLQAPPPARREDYGAGPTAAFMAPPPPVAPMAAAPPPVAAAPPPAIFKSWRIVFLAIPVVIVLATVILSLVVRTTPGGHVLPASSFGNALLFVLQMLLLTAVICLIPTLASWVVRGGWLRRAGNGGERGFCRRVRWLRLLAFWGGSPGNVDFVRGCPGSAY